MAGLINEVGWHLLSVGADKSHQDALLEWNLLLENINKNVYILSSSSIQDGASLSQDSWDAIDFSSETPQTIYKNKAYWVRY